MYYYVVILLSVIFQLQMFGVSFTQFQTAKALRRGRAPGAVDTWRWQGRWRCARRNTHRRLSPGFSVVSTYGSDGKIVAHSSFEFS